MFFHLQESEDERRARLDDLARFLMGTSLRSRILVRWDLVDWSLDL